MRSTGLTFEALSLLSPLTQLSTLVTLPPVVLVLLGESLSPVRTLIHLTALLETIPSTILLLFTIPAAIVRRLGALLLGLLLSVVSSIPVHIVLLYTFRPPKFVRCKAFLQLTFVVITIPLEPGPLALRSVYTCFVLILPTKNSTTVASVLATQLPP